jgi:outer membrane protein assembly factor BamE (lipoprotein component of BamABCDE complex)
MLMIMLTTLLLLTACTNFNRHRGVENTWRSIDQSQIVEGKTTQMDIAQTLGPPSQLIDLKGGTAFYYLTEQTHEAGVIFILFNYFDEKVIYDRAVFFFDQQGILQHYAFSKEIIDNEKN